MRLILYICGQGCCRKWEVGVGLEPVRDLCARLLLVDICMRRECLIEAVTVGVDRLARVPSKRLARDLVSSSMMVIGEVVLCLIFSVVRTARGDVAVLGGSAACDAAVTAAGVLTTVFFAKNARELAESLLLVEMLELRSIVSVVRAARDDVTMRGGFAACGPAEMFFLAVVACVR